MRTALAIDGGNSKTDVALIREDGALLGLARGGGSSPHHLGADPALDLIATLIDEVEPPDQPATAHLLLAGVDFPDEEAEIARLAAERGWAEATHVGNDTFAVLRAGTDRGWGVAVVCGAGINCVGVDRAGRTVRFPALGAISGDWGGGYDLGEAALFAAARSEDGRGPSTQLEQAVAAYFGVAGPSEVAHRIHRGRIARPRLAELAPVVVELADEDAASAAIVARLVDEVIAFVRAAVVKLELEDVELDVVLGGGLLQRAAPALIAEIANGVRGTAPHARVRPTEAPAIVGAALLVLDELGAGSRAKERVRHELGSQPVLVTIGGMNG